MSRGSAGRLVIGIVSGAFAVLPAVSPTTRPPARPQPEPVPLEVQWGHCAKVLDRQGALVCVYDPEDPVRLWIDHPRVTEARVLVDGVEVDAESYSLPEEPLGLGLRVRLPAGASELWVEVPDSSHVRVWGLLLVDAARFQDADPRAKAIRKELAAEYRRARTAGDPQGLRRAALRRLGWYEDHGRLLMGVFLLIDAVFILRQQRQFEVAEELLSRARPMAERFPLGRQALATHEGLLRWSQWQLYDAAELLRDGLRISLRIEHRVGLAESMHIYAEALTELGYYEEARRWAGRTLEHARGSCNRAAVLCTLGWINLQLRARGQPHDDPASYLNEAIALFRQPDGECSELEGAARLSLALLAFEDERLDEAREQLAAIDSATLSPEDRVRAADLRVRMRRAEAASFAAQWGAWRELRDAAEAVGDDDGGWRVATRRGEILAGSGRVSAAIEALEEAERRLDRLVRLQALVGVGRTATADRYLDSTLALVSLLVDEDRPASALCVARQARARRRSAVAGLDGLSAREREALRQDVRRHREHKRRAEEQMASLEGLPRDREAAVRHEVARETAEANRLVDEIVDTLMEAATSPTCEELTPAGPGELLVDVFPRERDWLVLVQDETSTRAIPVAVPDGGAPGGELLEPLDAELLRASRVRVLAHREAQELDVHQLPWRGRPLAASMPVTYGVELPARSPPPGQDPPQALLLADPTDTLINAQAELDAVQQRLQRAGWQTDRPTPTERDAGLGERGFAGYSLLHYAAHTEVDDEPEARAWPPYPGGVAAGQPSLQIGPTARLEAHTILARRPVPPVAFLAGCETGVVELDTGSTSVALAFLLADGHQVVASREALSDAVAVEIAERFYEAFVGEADRDAAAAMHQVQRAWTEQGRPRVPYRVWVR